VSQFVIPRRKRRGIQNDLIFFDFPGFPFGFAQGGEPVEPRVSPNIVGLARNDGLFELQHSQKGAGFFLAPSGWQEEATALFERPYPKRDSTGHSSDPSSNPVAVNTANQTTVKVIPGPAVP
jgi:hypothetical protein